MFLFYTVKRGITNNLDVPADLLKFYKTEKIIRCGYVSCLRNYDAFLHSGSCFWRSKNSLNNTGIIMISCFLVVHFIYIIQIAISSRLQGKHINLHEENGLLILKGCCYSTG